MSTFSQPWKVKHKSWIKISQNLQWLLSFKSLKPLILSRIVRSSSSLLTEGLSCQCNYLSLLFLNCIQNAMTFDCFSWDVVLKKIFITLSDFLYQTFSLDFYWLSIRHGPNKTLLKICSTKRVQLQIEIVCSHNPCL